MQPNPTAPQQMFLEAALDAGLQLCREAIWWQNQCNWVGASVQSIQGSFQLTQASCGPYIYSGVAGIALFLGQLSKHTAEPLVNETLEGAVNAMWQGTARQMPQGKVFYHSYYSGPLGVACALIRLGILRNRDDWQERGLELLKEVCAQPLKPGEVDVLAGASGAIPALLRLATQLNAPWLHAEAERCGEWLYDQGQEVARGSKEWLTIPGSPALTGYSHGHGGIGLAFLELYKATSEKHWLEAADMAFGFEAGHFDATQQNWPDLRQGIPQSKEQQASFSMAWCHGAPGIALARLRAWELTGNEGYKEEALTGLEATQKGMAANLDNFSLCHGAAGNASILLQGGQMLENAKFLQTAEETAVIGLERYHKNGLNWPAGVQNPNGGAAITANPSLMLGLAGTGYFFMQLALPAEVPTVLMPG